MLTRLVPRASLALRPLARAASSTPAATPPEKAPHPSAPAQTQSSSSSLSVQSPNYPKVWSTSQRAREDAYKEARFEQTALEFQPQPLSAMEMIAAEPIRLVHGRRAVCDGGMGPLGHPKVFINLDKPGPKPCGYCGLRFEQAPHSGHGHH